MNMENKSIDIKFGTEGWRGVISADFTFENVRIVSQAVADYLSSVDKAGKKIVIGYDNRFMSEKFAEVSAGVFVRNKYDVLLSDSPVTTPNLCHSVRFNDALIGIMITASHNPPRFNGIKVKAPYGGPVPDWVSAEIEKKVPGANAGILSAGEPFNIDTKTGDLKAPYLEYIKLSTDLDVIRRFKKNIVVDLMHGSGSGYFDRILKQDNVLSIRNSRDPLFGGVNPEPIEINLNLLKRTVKREKACAGIALDGDGDRIGVVDDRGVYLPPHIVFPLFLYYLAEYKKQRGMVVQTVSLGYLSERISREYGLGFKELPVGFKHICEMILKEDVLAGGEESGGYKVRGELPDRDGVLCGLVVLEMIASTGKKLSEWVRELQGRFGNSLYLRKDIVLQGIIYDKKEFSKKITDNLPSKLAGQKIKDVRSFDGVKIVLADDSWLLLRPSGTEPKLRIYAESPWAGFTRKLLISGERIVKG